MKITACPLCGSKNVGMGGIRDGVHPQEFLKQACKNCGWTGTPLEFDTDKEYKQFLNGLIKEDEILDKFLIRITIKILQKRLQFVDI